ncbi:MAG: hypothetical protein IKU29_00580 [Parabacteroides sp.]|nr:hypothetical protein [Parabacteroides sp.]
MRNIAADLAFLKCILTMLIQNDDVETKFAKAAVIIYNQIGPKQFNLQKARDISDSVNPVLATSVAKGFMDLIETVGKERGIEIFEITLREQIRKVTGQTDAELNNELIHASAITELMINGIHIDENGGIVNE